MGLSLEKHRKKWRAAKTWFTGTTVGSVVGAFALVVGILGSLLEPELTTYFHSWIPPALRIWMWILGLVLLGFVVFVRQNAIDERRGEAQQRLDEFPELLRTLPSEDFLAEMGVTLEKCHTFANECGIEKLPEALQGTLHSIAVLARTFDGTRSKRKFAANIMIFVRSDDANLWKECLKFVDPAVTLSGLQGVLALPANMIATEDPEVPSSVPEFCLPVPRDIGTPKSENGQGWLALPGAPLCFARKEFEYFCNMGELRDWFEQHGDFTKRVTQEVVDYFNSQEEIAGFFSTPIYAPSLIYQPHRERDVIAILNVHWRDSNRMHIRKSAKLFSEAIFPFRLLLSQLLTKYLEQRGAPCPCGENKS